MLPFVFHPLAEAELDEGVSYSESSPRSHAPASKKDLWTMAIR
jgi:hypothetical protein